VVSSCTVGLCEESEWQTKVSEVAQYPVIKIKTDHSGSLNFLRYVRERTEALLRVDANCSWAGLDIGAITASLRELGVEFVEQPLPPEENYRMHELLVRSHLPLIADESCRIPWDVPFLRNGFSGINIKLVKCGGLTPALEMVGTARGLGMKVMAGCMLESNLGIAAGTVLAQQADFADLDGSWLLQDTLFDGVSFEAGRLTLSGEPGFGVWPKEELF
jgi:L-alanine-DL-glutamate epimerase-like enolase superfamily enzyme